MKTSHKILIVVLVLAVLYFIWSKANPGASLIGGNSTMPTSSGLSPTDQAAQKTRTKTKPPLTAAELTAQKTRTNAKPFIEKFRSGAK